MRNFKKFLSCLVIITSIFITITVSGIADEDYTYGAFALSTAYQTVYKYNNTNSQTVGSVYAYEGITILYTQGSSYYIEYSSSTGAKRGYLLNPQVAWFESDNTTVGYVNTTSTTYCGPNTSTYSSTGTVYSGEYVAVLKATPTWAYIEYNTSEPHWGSDVFA